MAQQFIIYGDLSSRTLTDVSGSTLSLPDFYQGDKYTFALRLLDKISGTSKTPVFPNVRSLSASLGDIQTKPDGGSVQLKYGSSGEVSSKLLVDDDAATIQAALTDLAENATYPLVEVYVVGPGVWMLRYSTASEVPLQLAYNFLEPESFCRINQFLRDGRRWIEIKLLKAPYASTAASERVLSAAPSIARIRAGYSEDVGLETILTSEVQALTIPLGFQGTFELKFDGRSTISLSNSDTPDTIAAALNALYTDGETRFSVTNPIIEQAYIEFIGPLLGYSQDLITVEVQDVLPGDLTFSLDLNTAEVAAAMRLKPAGIETYFEVWLEIAPDGAAPEVPGDRFILFQSKITILPDLQYDGLSTFAPINWLTPPQPVDYIPFTLDEVLTGQQQAFPTTIGNGAATSFAITHGLACQICEVIVVEASTKRLLRDNEYVAVFNSINQVTISGFAATPTTGQYSVLIVAIGPASVFQAHTHTIGQIVGLQDVLDDLEARLSGVEDILPGNLPPSATGPTEADALKIEISDFAELLFQRRRDTFEVSSLEGASSPKDLPPVVGLLPAINKAAVDAVLPDPLPVPTVDALYSVPTDGIVLPGGYGVRAMPVNNGDFVGSDGRILYKVNKAPAKNSYFPSSYERTLFMVFINDSMFRLASTFSIDFKLAAQILNGTTNAQYVLVIELGAAPTDTTPDPTEINLENITWITTPGLKQRLILTRNRMTHSFGFQVLRSAIDVVTANKKVYGALAAADQAPASANFAIRARMIEFDTENSVVGARGLIYYALSDATASIA